MDIFVKVDEFGSVELFSFDDEGVLDAMILGVPLFVIYYVWVYLD